MFAGGGPRTDNILVAQSTARRQFRLAISVIMHRIAWSWARKMSGHVWLTDHFAKSTSRKACEVRYFKFDVTPCPWTAAWHHLQSGLNISLHRSVSYRLATLR